MSNYKRKTRDEYVIEQDWGLGWEEVFSEDTLREGNARLNEYYDNEPDIPVRLIKRRVLNATA